MLYIIEGLLFQTSKPQAIIQSDLPKKILYGRYSHKTNNPVLYNPTLFVNFLALDKLAIIQELSQSPQPNSEPLVLESHLSPRSVELCKAFFFFNLFLAFVKKGKLSLHSSILGEGKNPCILFVFP